MRQPIDDPLALPAADLLPAPQPALPPAVVAVAKGPEIPFEAPDL